MNRLSKDAGTRLALLRSRGSAARVSNEELVFDLVYVFAVTQLSHYLLDNLSLVGALQTLVMWFAVWIGWQYTAWVTNWFEPTALPIRFVLFTIMLVALVMASALPQAFGERGLIFACCYALIQVGRSLWVLLALGSNSPLAPNFRRITAWTLVAGTLWIAGGLAQDTQLRLGLWAVAIVCEYVAPMTGFFFPGLGRSSTAEWTIDGGHLAERCQLFVIVALGESLLASGVAFAQARDWQPESVYTLLVAFVGSLAMWWMYFDTGSKDAAHVIEHSDDPGGIGAKFHYTHVILVAGIIVSAVADELVIGHASHHAELKYLGALIGGPAIYLFGNTLFKHVVYGATPWSHLLGLALLVAILPFASHLSVAFVGTCTTLIMVAVAALEATLRRRSGVPAIEH